LDWVGLRVNAMLEQAYESAAPPARARGPARTLAGTGQIVAWWAATRALVVAGALFLYWFREPRGYFGPAIFHHAFGVLESWDGVWYRVIAHHGYLLVPGRQSDPAFFPLYPLLLKVFGWTGLPLGAAGLLLSNVLFLGALLAFDALGRELFDATLARRATLLLAVFPTSYVASMLYPESLVLLAFALAGLFAVRRRWLACATAATLAALARPEGLLIALPIAACVAAAWREASAEERGSSVAALLAAPAAAISYPLYLGWALHDPLAWTKAQHSWGRSFRPDGLAHAFTNFIQEAGHRGWAVRDFAFCFLTLALLGVAWRAGAPRSWLAVGVLIVVLPLTSGSFESDARFALLAVPAYWGLARLVPTRVRFTATVALSAALLVIATLTLPLVFP
jgi:Mannosyltransferase (PIG-V)